MPICVAPAGTTPAGACSISVADGPLAGLGISIDADGRPHAVVSAGPDWTLAVSHVLLEMIADPDGTRFMEGFEPARRAPGRRVRYLLEVCGPCQLVQYRIDGVPVADFVTPDYYRADAAPGTAFDFLRRLRRPLEVGRGGSLSWRDPADGRWHERRPDGTLATSDLPFEPGRNPREDRDAALGGGAARHDVQAIRRAHPRRR